MITAETAQSARDALWACIVELIESAHDYSILAQAGPTPTKAAHIKLIAIALTTLTDAVAATHNLELLHASP